MMESRGEYVQKSVAAVEDNVVKYRQKIQNLGEKSRSVRDP